jgi:hypothetical protein
LLWRDYRVGAKENRRRDSTKTATAKDSIRGGYDTKLEQRSKRDPYCFQVKRQLDMIADAFAEDQIGTLASARSVYLALSQIASDRQSDTFTVATFAIAHRAGVSPKTVRRVIEILKKLRLVKTRARSADGLKLATEYTLIR